MAKVTITFEDLSDGQVSIKLQGLKKRDIQTPDDLTEAEQSAIACLGFCQELGDTVAFSIEPDNQH